MPRLIFAILFTLSAGNTCALSYERFEQDGKVGIRDDQGQVVVPAAFEALGWSDGSFSLQGEITGYRKGTRWGLLNLKKEYITPADYLSLISEGGSFVRVSRDISAIATKVGCINLRGETVIPVIYDDLVIQDLRAVVMKKEGIHYKYGVVDLSNRVLVPVEYQQITPLGTLRYAVRNFEGRTALFTEEGKQVTGFEIDSLSQFQYGLAILYKGLYQGVIDRNGVIRVDPLYRDATIGESGNSVRVRKADLWKVIDSNQNTVRQQEADAMILAGPNRYRLALNRKFGIVDSLFNVLLPVAFDYVGPVIDDMTVLGQSGLYGLARVNGSILIPILFDTVIREGHLLRVRRTEQGKPGWHLYDTVGVKKTSVAYDEIEPSIYGRFPVFRNGYAGAIDKTGNELVACVYDSILEITGDAITVKFKGLYGIISREDVWRVTPQVNKVKLISVDRYMEIRGTLKVIKNFSGQVIYFTDNPLIAENDGFLETLPDGTEKIVGFDGVELLRRDATGTLKLPSSNPQREGLTRIKRDGKYGFVDDRGRLRIANRYEDAGDFNEGLAPVKLLGKWGFIDKSDQIVIHPTYDRQPKMEQGAAVVVRKSKAGIIDRAGNVLLELRYDSIAKSEQGAFLFFQNGYQGLADAKGKILLEPRFDSVLPIPGDRVIVRQDGQYGLLSREGLSLFPLRYESLDFQPQTGVFFVRQASAWETILLK